MSAEKKVYFSSKRWNFPICRVLLSKINSISTWTIWILENFLTSAFWWLWYVLYCTPIKVTLSRTFKKISYKIQYTTRGTEIKKLHLVDRSKKKFVKFICSYHCYVKISPWEMRYFNIITIDIFKNYSSTRKHMLSLEIR